MFIYGDPIREVINNDEWLCESKKETKIKLKARLENLTTFIFRQLVEVDAFGKAQRMFASVDSSLFS
jgi:hypothetical protein